MISIREIVRGALTRTAPAALLCFAAFVASSPVSRSQASLARVGFLVAASLAAAGGSAFALTILRARLRDDAVVAGRRAFITGMAAFGLDITARAFLLFGNPLGDLALMFASGLLIGGAMFLPWVQSAQPAILAEADDEDVVR